MGNNLAVCVLRDKDEQYEPLKKVGQKPGQAHHVKHQHKQHAEQLVLSSPRRVPSEPVISVGSRVRFAVPKVTSREKANRMQIEPGKYVHGNYQCMDLDAVAEYIGHFGTVHAQVTKEEKCMGTWWIVFDGYPDIIVTCTPDELQMLTMNVSSEMPLPPHAVAFRAAHPGSIYEYLDRDRDHCIESGWFALRLAVAFKRHETVKCLLTNPNLDFHAPHPYIGLNLPNGPFVENSTAGLPGCTFGSGRTVLEIAFYNGDNRMADLIMNDERLHLQRETSKTYDLELPDDTFDLNTACFIWEARYGAFDEECLRVLKKHVFKRRQQAANIIEEYMEEKLVAPIPKEVLDVKILSFLYPEVPDKLSHNVTWQEQ